MRHCKLHARLQRVGCQNSITAEPRGRHPNLDGEGLLGWPRPFRADHGDAPINSGPDRRASVRAGALLHIARPCTAPSDTSGFITTMITCPACQSHETVEGHLLPSADDGSTSYFYPSGLKLLAFKRSVALENGQQFKACTACGHVWSRVSAEQLKRLLERSGTGRAE